MHGEVDRCGGGVMVWPGRRLEARGNILDMYRQCTKANTRNPSLFFIRYKDRLEITKFLRKHLQFLYFRLRSRVILHNNFFIHLFVLIYISPQIYNNISVYKPKI